DVLQRAARLGYAGGRHCAPRGRRVEAEGIVTTRLVCGRGQGRRLAPRGAPQRARALDGLLPRLRRRSPLVRGLRGGGAGNVLLRRADASPLPCLRRSLL